MDQAIAHQNSLQVEQPGGQSDCDDAQWMQDIDPLGQGTEPGKGLALEGEEKLEKKIHARQKEQIHAVMPLKSQPVEDQSF